jgi:hypothetical protein
MLLVDDSFLTDKEILHYQELLYLKNSPGWVFTTGSPGPDTILNNKTALHGPMTENHTQFVHSAKYKDMESQPVCNESITLLNKFAEKHNIKVLSVLRIKANLMINSRTIRQQAGTAHVDSVRDLIGGNTSGNHFVLLYYVNDSDGPTVIYNEKYPVDNFDDLSVNQMIYPKAGKAILFDGDRYHSSSAPVETSQRFVININFIGKIN